MFYVHLQYDVNKQSSLNLNAIFKDGSNYINKKTQSKRSLFIEKLLSKKSKAM